METSPESNPALKAIAACGCELYPNDWVMILLKDCLFACMVVLYDPVINKLLLTRNSDKAHYDPLVEYNKNEAEWRECFLMDPAMCYFLYRKNMTEEHLVKDKDANDKV